MPWYNSLGQGMGDTLLFSNEKGAYTLADRGTYLSMQDKLPNLTILVGGQEPGREQGQGAAEPLRRAGCQPGEVSRSSTPTWPAKFVEWITLGRYAEDDRRVSGRTSSASRSSIPVRKSTRLASRGFVASADQPALKITGKVGKEQGWSEADVKALKTMDVQYTNSKGVTATYTGVPISELLALAVPAADAKTIEFVASDGYTAEAPLADVQACKDCIVAFQAMAGSAPCCPTSPRTSR